MSAGRDLTFAISADYARKTGGWIYDQQLLAGLSGRGWQMRRLTLPAGFPAPSPEARAEAGAALHALPGGRLVLIDQLCLGVLPEVARAEAGRLRLVMIVHHPLALEGYDGAAARFADCEREALRHVAAVITTSPSTARTLGLHYGVASERIIVAPPGVERRPLARGSGGPVLNLLALGAVVPRKNHALLIAALAGLRQLPWRLSLVGNLARAPDHVAALRGMIAGCGLSGRVRLTGELADDRLARLWLGTDLYVSASRHEGYGMAIQEAFAHGVPVVATQAGAVGAWVGRRGARLVRDCRLPALRTALAAVLASTPALASLRRGAIARRRALSDWETTARQVEDGLQRLIERRS